MELNFLKYYLNNNLYLENPPMNMKKFISFCKDRGVNINQQKLEELERKKVFYPIFRSTNIKDDFSKKFEELIFDKYPRYDFSELLENNQIFIPKDHEFIEFKNFNDEETKKLKTYSYYSSFQILPLIVILKHDNVYDSYLSILDNFVNLLIAIQIYAPYGRSNDRVISLETNAEIFYENLKKFDLEEVLDVINLNENSLYKAYAEITSKLSNYLGSDDLIQLWKNISWSEKKKCKGDIRLGIEYLQWALMLKKCIEDYIGHETFDIDEVGGDWEKIPDKLPSFDTGRSLRGIRNDSYYNEKTGEYEFSLNRKKLFYLSNKLTLDYHPRVILFVEGETEEKMIPKFFEFYGHDFNGLRLEIVNIGGITKFYSGNIKQEKVNSLLVNNFRNLITFNLELWQAIPFFIGDNENDILKKLEEGKIFDIKRLIESSYDKSFGKVKKEIENDYGKLNESMIKEWMYIWDYDFELDNYDSFELKEAINSVCHTNYSVEDIQEIYDSCDAGHKKGITSLNKSLIKRKKIEINEKAFQNLVEYYKKTKDPKIAERPIFKLINKISDIHRLNRQPWDTKQDRWNKKELVSNILIRRNVFQK